jgi:hypothetical protein
MTEDRENHRPRQRAQKRPSAISQGGEPRLSGDPRTDGALRTLARLLAEIAAGAARETLRPAELKDPGSEGSLEVTDASPTS